MTDFTWSYSRLKNWETCALRHYHYDIAKDVTEPESGMLAEGHAVHKALELRIASGKKLPLGMGQYESVAAKLEALPGENYAEQKLAITEKFAPVGFFGSGVWFRTVLDFTNVHNTTAAIIDYKTGKVTQDTTQLQLMSATIFHHAPEVQRVRARLLFLNHNHAERAEFVREDLPEIWGEILPRVRRMREAVEGGKFPPKPSGLCKRYCAVQSCPYHGVGSMP